MDILLSKTTHQRNHDCHSKNKVYGQYIQNPIYSEYIGTINLNQFSSMIQYKTVVLSRLRSLEIDEYNYKMIHLHNEYLQRIHKCTDESILKIPKLKAEFEALQNSREIMRILSEFSEDQ